MWTFTIREGLTFADGEEILPSTFQRSWERAADIGGDYSYLLNFIDGGRSVSTARPTRSPASSPTTKR